MALEQGANFEVENTRRATAASLELFGVWSLELGTGGCRAARGTTLSIARVLWSLRAHCATRGGYVHTYGWLRSRAFDALRDAAAPQWM